MPPDQSQTTHTPQPQTNPMPPTHNSTAASGRPAKLPSAFTLLKPSTKAFLKNFWTFAFLWAIPVAMLLIIVIVIQLTISSNIQHNGFEAATGSPAANATTTGINIFAIVFGFIAVLLFIPITTAYIYVQLKSVRGQKAKFRESFKVGLRYSLRFIGLGIIVGLLILGGFLLLIVPGLIMLRRYILSPYYLIDQNLSISDAMKKSAEESKRFSKGIWGLIGVDVLLAAISIIPLFGWFVGTLLQLAYFCAPAKRYDEIQQMLNPGTNANMPHPNPAPHAPAV